MIDKQAGHKLLLIIRHIAKKRLSAETIQHLQLAQHVKQTSTLCQDDQ